MKITMELYDNDEGSSEEVTLPAKYEVCWRCQGAGVHDCWEGGMTSDEMYEQGPEFVDDYFDGVYDTRCTVCRGERVLAEVDRNRLTAEMRARYDKHVQQRAEWEAELAHEQRMGY
jgi:hypothetical protein